MEAILPIVVILGPTGGGKTAVAIELARRLTSCDGTSPGGECVGADSMQVYRGLDIGTAKPTKAQRALVPHHLLDLFEPDEEGFSVDGWLRAARKAIEAIRRRGRRPIVVGGTNLYVQALLKGLFEGPGADPRLRAELAALSSEQLRAQLEAIDPVVATRLHPNDRRRSIRAIEVIRSTGRSIDKWQTQWQRSPRRDIRVVGLEYTPQTINRRINARVRAMFAAGLVAEARGLWSSGRLGRQAAEALGYKQLLEHFEGRMSLEEAAEAIKIQTRRYAKKQRTWLKRFRADPFSRWFSADDETPQTLAAQILRCLEAPVGDLTNDQEDQPDAPSRPNND